MFGDCVFSSTYIFDDRASGGDFFSRGGNFIGGIVITVLNTKVGVTDLSHSLNHLHSYPTDSNFRFLLGRRNRPFACLRPNLSIVLFGF